MKSPFVSPTLTAMRRPVVRRSGFTLVELLTVILVISVLIVVGVLGVRNLSKGKGTTAAVASAEGLFDEARQLAIAKGTSARLLVDVDDPENSENYLRRIVIAYRHSDDDGEAAGQWVLANRGYQLPEGVYFSREFSSGDHAGSGNPLAVEAMSYFMLDDANNTVAVSETGTDWNGDYVFYEFNSQGICQVPGASFIIGSGSRSPGSDMPQVTGGASCDFGGLLVLRNGRTSRFRGPEQMGLAGEIGRF